MAVDFSKLKTSLAFQQVFVDQTLTSLVSQVAAGARVFFYETDKITLKNVYIATGTPASPSFVVAANPQVTNAAGRLEQPVYLYLFDEDDDEAINEQLYYIQVINTLDTTIYETNDWPQNEAIASEVISSPTNLASDYGLLIPLRADFYGDETLQFIENVGNYPAMGYVWVISDPGNGDFFYRFTQPTLGTLDGDPLNLITLTQENFGSSQTNVYFGFPVCQFPELIGSTLNLQFIAQDQSTIPVTSLDIGIIRAPSPTLYDTVSPEIDWDPPPSPINVGSITLSTSLETKSLSFTMPSVVTTPDTSAATYIVISLPSDQAFQIALTGFYVYLGDSVTLDIQKDNLGARYAKTFFQAMNNFLLSFEDINSENLPLMKQAEQGTIGYQTRTGAIFKGAINADQAFNFAVPLAGQTIAEGYSYNFFTDGDRSPGGNVLPNRLFANFSDFISLSFDSFVVDNVTATSLDVTTVGGTTFYTDWASFSAAIVITTTGGPSSYPISASIGGGPNTNRVDIVFSTDYLALGGIDINIQATNVLTPPADGVMINWNGTLGPSGIAFIFTWTAGPLTFATIVDGDSITPAECQVTFPVAGMTPSEIQTYYDPNLGTIVGNDFWGNILAFNDLAASGDDIPMVSAPYVIAFHVDSAGATPPVSNQLLTVNFDLADLATGDLMAQKMVDQLTASTINTLTFSAVPSNGDWILFSNENNPLNMVYWITNQTKPDNPVPSRAAIYVSLSPSAIITDAIAATQLAFINQVGALPTARDIGELTIPSSLSLYMET